MATMDKLSCGPQTLLDALEKRAGSTPDRVAYRFLREGELEVDRLTFGELRKRARIAAAHIAATGTGMSGERAILLYPQSLEFVVAFFGCLYAGVIAIPASVPQRKHRGDAIRRMA